MIPEDTYISYFTHQLVRTLDADHAVLAATIVDMCSHSEDGTMEISLEYLAGVIGISKRTIQRQLQKLQLLNVVVYESGDGRGNYGTFRKGDNYDTFSGIKGDKNGTLLEQERVTNFAKKGDKNGTHIYTDIITAANAPACRREQHLEVAAADGELEKGSPRQGKEKEKMNTPTFQEFWDAFKVQPEYENRKTRCEGVWAMMPPEYRTAVVKELKAGKKHRANPLHYLQYYTPADVKPEFPIFRNGDASIADAIHEAEVGGRALAFVRAGATLHIPDNFAHIYLIDAIANKINVIRTIPACAMLQVPEELKEAQP